jgi:hypothetical protein
MLEQLIWIEIALKLAGGLVLLLVPRTFARVAGLPAVGEPFWARCLGGVLVGLAFASFLESRVIDQRGLGLAGSIAINFTAAFTLIALLILRQGGRTRRGRALIAVFIAVLVVLGLIELAWALPAKAIALS